jgi:hypothetical protein
VKDSQTTVQSASQALSITTVLTSAANNSQLNGQYAFLFEGFDDATGAQIASVGSFTADGKGKITAGIEDENGPNGPALNVSFTGTYNIGSDNRGAFTMISASGLKTYALVLNSTSNGEAQKARFAEFDDTTGKTGQRGSGLLRKQDVTAFLQNKIKGPYAFGLQGQDAKGNRAAMAGSFIADGAGIVTGGIMDQVAAGTDANPSLSGSYTVPSTTNGRAKITLNPSGAASRNLSTYIVSASELLVMTTGALTSDGLVSGTAMSQSSTSFDVGSLNSPAVFYLLGINPDSTAAIKSIAQIGLLLPDGNGNLSTTVTSTTSQQDLTSNAAYSVLASGRVTISGWSGDPTNPPRILYLVDKNRAVFLDTSGIAGLGFVEPQSPTPSSGFSNGSFQGRFSAATAAPSVNGNLNATGIASLDGAGTFSESTNLSSTSGLFVNQTTSGTYAIAANGRGTVTSLTVTTASISPWVLTLAVSATILLGFRNRKHNRTRPGFAICCFALVFATTPVGCPFPKTTNQLVFYMVSPSKAVMLHEHSFNYTPEITIIEQ